MGKGETYAIAPVPSLPAIGCKRDAVAALKGDLRQIGKGAMRTAYCNAAGTVVYKIASRNGGGPARNTDNESEYLSLLNYRVKGHTWASGCALYYVLAGRVVATSDGTSNLPPDDIRTTATAVLAMRFYPVDGTDAQVTTDFRRKTQHRGIFLPDMHSGNYRGTGRKRVRVTDLGAVRW